MDDDVCPSHPAVSPIVELLAVYFTCDFSIYDMIDAASRFLSRHGGCCHAIALACAPAATFEARVAMLSLHCCFGKRPLMPQKKSKISNVAEKAIVLRAF
jgi:hypothetical protein